LRLELKRAEQNYSCGGSFDVQKMISSLGFDKNSILISRGFSPTKGGTT